MKKEFIKCSECEHCDRHKPWRNSRTEFRCEHPDQGYIINYFFEKRIKKDPGFLGFGKSFNENNPVKTSPAWCPKKKKVTGGKDGK